jgi:hypothetical protein
MISISSTKFSPKSLAIVLPRLSPSNRTLARRDSSTGLASSFGVSGFFDEINVVPRATIKKNYFIYIYSNEKPS